MTETFAFDGPQFVDFSRNVEVEDTNNTESYFEIDHENRQHSESASDSGEENNCDFYSPMQATPFKSRRSISAGNLHLNYHEEVNTISQAFDGLQVSSSKKSKKRENTVRNHRMLTRSSVQLKLRSRSVSRDHINLLAQPKCKNSSADDVSSKKFVSMAEAIIKYQRDTPDRFHTKPKINNFEFAKPSGPACTTIAQSPALATKARARPTMCLSTADKELMDFEEAKKFKIKALPVNSKILHGPVVPVHVPIKKSTVLQPFHLTEVPPKKEVKEAVFEFHAQPIPKGIFEKLKPIEKRSVCTAPVTPKLMKRYKSLEQPKVEAPRANNESILQTKLTGTKLKPFSFELRDKELQKRKEEQINKILLKEKQAREFHARPLPKSIFKSPIRKTEYHHMNGTLSSHKSNESVVENHVFKAKPAKVLGIKPFEPKKIERTLTEITPFDLNTDYRAKQRLEFDKKLKEKEETVEEYKRQQEQARMLLEEKEKIVLRKQAQFKAKPIRQYKEVPHVGTKELTDPKSPNFVSKNKEN